jgi:hypothetical protein
MVGMPIVDSGGVSGLSSVPWNAGCWRFDISIASLRLTLIEFFGVFPIR